MLDPLVSLLRRWAVDWLDSADPSVCPEILAPEYGILIGGHRLDGREAYIAGTMEQLNRFPGLMVTVHEVISSGEQAAVRFSEHGASERLEWREAAWTGVAVFGWDGAQLTRCCAEEDYLSRRRQLDSGVCDPIARPAPSPWTTRARAPDPEAESAVRRWLARGDFAAAQLDDDWLGHDASLELVDAETTTDELFSAGDRVAFHGVQRGRYARGLDGIAATDGTVSSIHFSGIVQVVDGEVAGGHVVRDRLGLQRSLNGRAR